MFWDCCYRFLISLYKLIVNEVGQDQVEQSEVGENEVANKPEENDAEDHFEDCN